MEKSLSLTSELRQQQKLTPLQVQFVRMLEMTGPEAEEEVRRALDEMPALEAVDDSTASEAQSTEDGALFTESDRDMQRADFRSDDDVPDYLADSTPTTAAVKGEFEFDAPVATRRSFDSVASMPEPTSGTDDETLLDTLTSQLNELSFDDTDRRIAQYIIGSIDNNGYLTRTPRAIADDLAINEGMWVEATDVERVLHLIQQMEPAGVGATDLRECLLLQPQRLPRSAESLTAREVIASYFDLFTKKHFDRIASAMGISRDDLDNALAVISRLNPKPGSALASNALDERTRHITPDFAVETDAAGNLSLTLLNRIPELRVEATFNNEGALTGSNEKRLEEARMFIRRKRDDARNFIKVVSLRQETLFKVMSAILRLQHKFFITEQDEDIRPMVLRDIAAITGYNLSVISRATQGKYVATVRGIYPLKKFFNEKLRDDNEQVTANRIIAEIKNAIANEDPTNPLSDREITARLEAAGFDIARRTVAKYRENLGFPVARLRKRR